VCHEKMREARVFFRDVLNRSMVRGEYSCKKKIVHPQPAPPRKKTLKSNPQPTKITKKSTGLVRVCGSLHSPRWRVDGVF
jgi:hypothetical protein